MRHSSCSLTVQSMKNFLTHWTFSFITLIVLTFIGLQEHVKEILKPKSFDILIQQEEKQVSQDIGIVTIDEGRLKSMDNGLVKRDVLAKIIYDLRRDGAGVIMISILFQRR